MTNEYIIITGNVLIASDNATPVVVTGSPVAGQAIVATDSGDATWSNVDAGAITLGGDVTGPSSSNEVISIQGVIISGAASNGKVLQASSSSAASWQTPASGFTAGGDLSGTSSSQTVVSISGSTPIVVSAATLEFAATTSTPSLTQATTTAGAGTSLTIAAQSSTHGGSGGGDLDLYSGNAVSAGQTGNINIYGGATRIMNMKSFDYDSDGYVDVFSFDGGMVNPQITQFQMTGAGANNGYNTQIISQQGQQQSGSNANNNGGALALSSGEAGTGGGGAAGAAGHLQFQTGNVTRMRITPTNIIVNAFNSAGVVHNDSSGNLSTSLLVNADVSTSAAVAVSKLATGTASQFLGNSSAPTPTWYSMSGDAALTAGAIEVTGLLSHALPGLADGYLNWTGSAWALSTINVPAPVSLIYLVGGSGENVYGTWAALMAAVVEAGNAMTFITLDGSGGALHATAGTWNLDMCTFATRVGGTTDELTFDNGCVINWNTLWLNDGAIFIGNSTSTISVMNSNQDLYLTQGSQIYTNSGKSPFFTVASGVTPEIFFDEVSIFGDGTDSTCAVASGGNLTVYAFSGDGLKADSVSGAGTLTLNMALAGSVHTQTVTTENVTYTSLVKNLAPGTSAQVLLNNATPTPTWTTLAGDMTVGATGTTVVAKANGIGMPSSASNYSQLTYNGTSWVGIGILSATLTDANVTVDCGASSAGSLNANQFVLPAATLSTNRTLTMNTDSAVTGESMTIVRLDKSANTYAVVNGGAGAGTMYTFPASKSRVASFAFDGTNWSLVSTAAGN